jgi:hypothetical protein
MTLLTICQTVLRETGKFQVPSTIVSNADPTAVQLLALANRTGRTLANDLRWQVLLSTYTFATVASTANYSLPSDFGRFANLTQWDRTNDNPVRGPVTAMEWEYLQSSGFGASSIFDKVFRIAGNYFAIYPTPDTSDETIAFQYYSKNWITNKTAFSADDDTALIDEDLIILGTKWRWLQAKGDSFENEKLEYQQRLDSLQAGDGGRDVIRFGSRFVENGAGNIPDVGFGS